MDIRFFTYWEASRKVLELSDKSYFLTVPDDHTEVELVGSSPIHLLLLNTDGILWIVNCCYPGLTTADIRATGMLTGKGSLTSRIRRSTW